MTTESCHSETNGVGCCGCIIILLIIFVITAVAGFGWEFGKGLLS